MHCHRTDHACPEDNGNTAVHCEKRTTIKNLQLSRSAYLKHYFLSRVPYLSSGEIF